MLGVAAIIRSTTGEPEITTKELIIHTTSISPLWSVVLVNNGGPLSWSSSGGVIIAEQEYTGDDVPIMNLENNTGTAIISIKSSSSFVGLIELYADDSTTINADNIIYIDVSNAIELLGFSCKGHDNLSSVDISTLTDVQSITFRSNPLMTSIDVSNNPDILNAWLYDMGLTDYDVLSTPLVTLLYLDGNNIGSTELDSIINRLDESGQVGGALRITGNTGSLTSNAYYGYQNLKPGKGWTIDVDLPEEPAKIPEPKPGSTVVLYDFSVENTTPSRVDFKTTSTLSSLSTTGFTISGTSIVGSNATINPDLRSGYFTVTTPFTFWNNSTIRLENGADTVHDFTLLPITNNIAEPSNSNIKYVSVAGGGDGTSPASPWTLVQGFTNAVEGMTVYVKNGDYGLVNVTLTEDGSPTAPIKFIGYNDTDGIGVTPNLEWSYPSNTGLDSAVMPLMGGSNNTTINTRLIEGTGRSNWIFKNLQMRNVISGFSGTTNSNFYFENIIGEYFGTQPDPTYDGSLISFGQGTSDVDLSINYISDHIRIKDCIGLNASNNTFFMMANHSAYINTIAISDWAGSYTASDYYFGLRGANNIITDCFAYRNLGTGSHNGHGFDIKSEQIPTQYNLVYNCDSLNVYQAYVLRHTEVKYNVIKNSVARTDGLTNLSGGIVIRDGASYNILENMRVSGATSSAVRFVDTTGEPKDYPNAVTAVGNKIVNGVFYNNKTGIECFGYDGLLGAVNDNEFINCTFDSQYYMFFSKVPNTGNKLVNCTITYTNLLFDTDSTFSLNWDYENCNWYQVGFGIPTGTDQIAVIPDFIDGLYTTYSNSIGSADPKYTYQYNYGLEETSGLIDAGKTVDFPKYDAIGTERDSTYDIGAYAISTALKPIMTNFRIEDDDPSRVYFDTPLGSVLGIDQADFTISGKNIIGLNTTNNYFTVDSAFTFWNQAITIKQVGGNGTVYDFPLNRVVNQIDEPTTSQVRYVSATATGSDNGLTTGTPWRLSQAGDAIDNIGLTDVTIWVKAGTYSNGQIVNKDNVGNTSTVKIIGYTNTPEDITDYEVDNFNDYPTDQPNLIDPDKYPVMSGDNSKAYFFLNSFENFIIKNIQIEGYHTGGIAFNNDSSKCVVENVSINKVDGDTSNNAGNGVLIQQGGTINNISVIKSVILDASAVNIYFKETSYGFAEGNKLYCGRGTVNDYEATDYYIGADNTSYSVFINNHAERLVNVLHNGHAFGVKKSGSENLIEDNESYGISECFYAAWHEVHDNVFRGNFIGNTAGQEANSTALVARDGAYNNIFENNYGDDIKNCTYTWKSTEDNLITYAALNNTFRNNIFKNFTESMVYYNNDQGGTYALEDNKWYNNTYYTTSTDARVQRNSTSGVGLTFSGNEFKNNIIYLNQGSSVLLDGTAADSDLLKEHNDWYNCPFATPSGTGNISLDPSFEDLVNFRPTEDGLISAIRLDGIYYDAFGNERNNPTTMGYYLDRDEVSSLTPIMTNFRIIEAEPSKVYFDAPLGSVDGTDITKYAILNRGITGIDSTLNFFTVDAPFTFWDNTQISQTGGNGIVYDFTREIVDNQMDEPDAAINKFVADNASGSGDGSEGNPWTFEQGIDRGASGQTVWIKAGSYTVSERILKYKESGTATAPIKWVGYTSDWTNGGDITTPLTEGFTYTGEASATALKDPNVYPVINNTQISTVEVPQPEGIYIRECDYIIFKNICLKGGVLGFQIIGNKAPGPWNGEGAYLYNIVSGATAGSGYAYRTPANYTFANQRMEKCIFHDGDGSTFAWNGDNNHFFDSGFYHEEPAYNVDYSYNCNGGDNVVVSGCTVTEIGGVQGAQGLSHKTTENAGEESSGLGYGTNLLFVDNNINDTGAGITATAIWTDGVVMKRNNVKGTIATFVPRDGVENVIIEDNYMENVQTAIYPYLTIEPWQEPSQEIPTFAVKNVIMRNNIVNGYQSILRTYNNNPGDTADIVDLSIYNNTFYNGIAGQVIWFNNSASTPGDITITSMSFENNIIKDAAGTWMFGSFGAGFTQDYNTYHNVTASGYSLPSGTGNVEIDPEFATVVEGGFLPTTADANIMSANTKNLAYDNYKTERDIDNTAKGGVAFADESGGIPPVESYDYYVSEDGNGDGSSDSTPMSFADSQTTINSMTSGQSIAYKGGDEFPGALTMDGRTNITITSYGTGQAKITGGEEITGWIQNGNVWLADVTGKTIYNVEGHRLASYPKIVSDFDTSDNYYTATFSNSTTFTSPDLIGFPVIVGATIQLSVNNYTKIPYVVSTFNSGTGEVVLTGSSVSTGDYKFHVTDHINLLDAQNEWYYEGNTLSIYSTSIPTGITATTNNGTGITVTNSDNISIVNIEVSNYNVIGISTDYCDYFTLDNCTIANVYEQGLRTNHGTNASITNNTFKNCVDYAINLRTSLSLVDNNYLFEIGMLKNITAKDATDLYGIEQTSSDVIISNNELEKIGYIGIRIYGQDCTVEKNFIHDFCLTTHDGGGIYTWAGSGQETAAEGLLIDRNTVLNDSIDQNYLWFDYPIYLDDYSHDIMVTNNTVSNGTDCIYLHISRDTEINNNNLYNGNFSSIKLLENASINGRMERNNVNNNNMLNDNIYQVLRTRSTIASTFDYGTFDFNKYWSVQNDDTVRYEPDTGVVIYDLSGWKTFTGGDINSTNNTSTIINHQLVYNETSAQKDVSLVGVWEDLDGNQYNGTITLIAYSGKILVQY